MIRDLGYYRTFDLLKASEMIRSLGSERGQFEVFSDAIQSLVIVAVEHEIESRKILDVLGEPDRMFKNSAGEVWEYDWTDNYGPSKYKSSTPFQICSGVCRGLATDA